MEYKKRERCRYDRDRGLGINRLGRIGRSARLSGRSGDGRLRLQAVDGGGFHFEKKVCSALMMAAGVGLMLYWLLKLLNLVIAAVLIYLGWRLLRSGQTRSNVFRY